MAHLSKQKIDVVKADIPLLLGLDFLDSSGLIVDNMNNQLENKIFGYKMPIVRKFGHLYLEWNISRTLFTRAGADKNSSPIQASKHRKSYESPQIDPK